MKPKISHWGTDLGHALRLLCRVVSYNRNSDYKNTLLTLGMLIPR